MENNEFLVNANENNETEANVQEQNENNFDELNDNLKKDYLGDKLSLSNKIRKIKRVNLILTIFSFICVLIFILLGIGFGYVYLKFGKMMKLPSGLTKATDSSVATESETKAVSHETLDINKISDKLEFIDGLISNYYYYGKDSEINDKIEDNIYSAYVNSLGDMWAEYYPKKEFDEFTESTSGEYYGIGAAVSYDNNKKVAIINEVNEDSPAMKAGVMPKDEIRTVDGEDVVGKTLEEIVSKVKGLENTTVRIGFYRESIDDIIELDVVRGKVEVKSVTYEILEDSIGYIKIVEFSGKAIDQFKQSIDSLINSQVESLIFDVRNNPGGELGIVLTMLDYLIRDNDGRYTLNQKDTSFQTGKTLIVYMKDKETIIDEYYCDDGHEVKLPMIVLTNNSSASAAELFTAVLRDYKKATVVGVKSFGKGVVQNMIELGDGSAVKFTVSEYFPPSGYSIDKIGILPDFSLDYSGVEVLNDSEGNFIFYENGKRLIVDRTGKESVDLSYVPPATNSEIDKEEEHVENKKIYDEKNEFIYDEWFGELDNKYDDKQLLQAIVILS